MGDRDLCKCVCVWGGHAWVIETCVSVGVGVGGGHAWVIETCVSVCVCGGGMHG